MTSLQNFWFSKLHILQNLIGTICLPNFIDLGCLDQILRGLVENTLPQTYTLSKSPLLIGLKDDQFDLLMWSLLSLLSLFSYSKAPYFARACN